MADILESILGDRLYLPDEKSLYEPLPSPEEWVSARVLLLVPPTRDYDSLLQLFSFICRLKGRVLIKGKRLMDSEAQASDDTDSDDDSEIGDEHRTMVEAGGSPVSMDDIDNDFPFLWRN